MEQELVLENKIAATGYEDVIVTFASDNVNVFETEREDGGFYRMLTCDEVFQKYKGLKQFKVKDMWDKYVSISE